MRTIVACLNRLVQSGVVDAASSSELVPFLAALEKHFNAGVQKVPEGWVEVAMDAAVTAFIASRNKDVFVSTYYTLIDAYAECCK